MTEFINSDLYRIRNIVKNITKICAQLDESQLCNNCTPNKVSQPTIILTLKYQDSQFHTVCTNNLEDYRILEEFLNEKAVHVGNYGAESPLIEHIHIIEKMTGVKLRSED